MEVVMQKLTRIIDTDGIERAIIITAANIVDAAGEAMSCPYNILK